MIFGLNWTPITLLDVIYILLKYKMSYVYLLFCWKKVSSFLFWSQIGYGFSALEKVREEASSASSQIRLSTKGHHNAFKSVWTRELNTWYWKSGQVINRKIIDFGGVCGRGLHTPPNFTGSTTLPTPSLPPRPQSTYIVPISQKLRCATSKSKHHVTFDVSLQPFKEVICKS